MYSELQDSRLTLMEVMDEYVERRVLSEEDHNVANTFYSGVLNEFFGRNFLGGILWEEFFGRNFLGGIFWEFFVEFFGNCQ